MAQAQTSDILDNEGKEKKDNRVVFFFISMHEAGKRIANVVLDFMAHFKISS